MKLASLIRGARESKKMSQQALAWAAGVSVSTVIRLEGGQLMPLAPSLFALAQVLELDLAEVSDAVLGKEFSSV